MNQRFFFAVPNKQEETLSVQSLVLTQKPAGLKLIQKMHVSFYGSRNKWIAEDIFLLFPANQYVNERIVPLADGGGMCRRFLIDGELLVAGFSSLNNIFCFFFSIYLKKAFELDMYIFFMQE